MKPFFIAMTTLTILMACQPKPDLSKAVQEIRQVEEDFANLADEKGVAVGFYEFAAEGAVINRGGLIKGRDAIKAFYDPIEKAGTKFQWSPDTVVVSESGDMGYTYGKYQHFEKDSLGNFKVASSGVFHTVWKKQKDGSWKYVWD
jgi:ketosteroid isomerase-like protein